MRSSFTKLSLTLNLFSKKKFIHLHHVRTFPSVEVKILQSLLEQPTRAVFDAMPLSPKYSKANLLHSDLALMTTLLSVSIAKSRGKSGRKDSAGKKKGFPAVNS